jgi:hypothetical protein
MVQALSRTAVVTQQLWLKSHVFADEGTYFVTSDSTNSADGTGINTGGVTQTGYVATTPTMTIFNNGTNKIYLDFLTLFMTVGGASLTSWRWAMYGDTTNRYTSGGTVAAVVNRPDMSLATFTASAAVIYFGAITAAAAGANVRFLGKGIFRNAIPVVGDMYTLNFGSVEQGMSQSQDSGTNSIAQMFAAPPVIIWPGFFWALYTWGPSMATTSPAASYQLGFVERSL